MDLAIFFAYMLSVIDVSQCCGENSGIFSNKTTFFLEYCLKCGISSALHCNALNISSNLYVTADLHY